MCPTHTEGQDQQTEARSKTNKDHAESGMMVAYKKGTVDVAERDAFTELSKLLRTTHLEHQQFSREPLSEALETTAKLLQRSAAMHFREVSVGIAALFLQTQQLAEHLATVAADFVERGTPAKPTGAGRPRRSIVAWRR